MPSNNSDFERFYQDNILRYQQLKGEVEFILNDIVQRTQVKIHSVSGRVKELDGIREKIRRKEYSNPAEEIEDIVGCRIVCLFVSDLAKLQEAIMEEFVVQKSEDKVEGGDDEATFGYMSKHYICQLGAAHSGPRYNNLKGITFEIQCRTILMDAWANVSHYLAYKGTVSIPAHLRRDFFALSGLFYVADKHFELFLTEAITSEQDAVSKVISGEFVDDDINLETVQALCAELYPNREGAGRLAISQFVEEVSGEGYKKLSELREDLERAANAALIYERDHPPFLEDDEETTTTFNQVGIARQALGILGKTPEEEDQRWDDYRQYVKQ